MPADGSTRTHLRCLLESPGVRVADGAMGTALQHMGLPAGDPPELWNETRPEAVRSVHRSYAEAGSEILLTNSFGGNRIKLEARGLQGKCASLCRRAAELCRLEAEDRVVLGSIGPTGLLLIPFGELKEEQAITAFAEQARSLAQGGVDGLILETFYDPRELELALRASLEHTDLQVGCCMTFDARGRTVMGTSVAEFVSRVSETGTTRVAFVGANCSLGPEAMEAVCAELHRSAQRPVWIKANAGLPQLIEERTVYPSHPESFAHHAGRWVEAGAKVVGGCCGTTPDHIRKLVEEVRR